MVPRLFICGEPKTMKKPHFASLYAGGVNLCAAWRDRLQAAPRDRLSHIRRASCETHGGEATDLRLNHFAPPTSRRASLITLLHAVAIAYFSLALLAYAYTGLFARYVMDDHCVAADLWEHGFFGAQRHWYMTFTGRYTMSFALGVVELIGPGVVPFLPLLALALWLAALTWAVRQFGRTFRWQQPLSTSLLAAEIIIYTVLRGAPTLHQALYWVGGLMTYLAPLVLLTFYTGFLKHSIDRRARGPGRLLLSAGFAFLIGGFSETNLALQTAALLIATIACWRGAIDPSFRRAAPALLAAGFLGSVLAIQVSLPAPGNAVRLSLSPPPPTLLPLISESLRHPGSLVVAATRTRLPLTMSVALLLPALFALTSPAQGKMAACLQPSGGELLRWLPLSSAAAFSLIVCCVVPSVYAQSYVMPRVLLIPQFVIVCFVVCWSYVAGLALRQIYPRLRGTVLPYSVMMVCALLALGPLTAARRATAASSEFKAQAALWDETEGRLRAARRQGVKRLVVPRPHEVAEIEGLSTDPNFYVNRCVARYYGLDSVTAR